MGTCADEGRAGNAHHARQTQGEFPAHLDGRGFQGENARGGADACRDIGNGKRETGARMPRR